MEWTDALLLVIGNLSFPIVLYAIGRVNPDIVAFAVTVFLEKLFANKTLRNRVSNSFGIKLVKIGLALITIISDDSEKILELIGRLKSVIEELESQLREVAL